MRSCRSCAHLAFEETFCHGHPCSEGVNVHRMTKDCIVDGAGMPQPPFQEKVLVPRPWVSKSEGASAGGGAHGGDDDDE
eukprot:27414-Eustigmatos_ZCMA.PRE.1